MCWPPLALSSIPGQSGGCVMVYAFFLLRWQGGKTEQILNVFAWLNLWKIEVFVALSVEQALLYAILAWLPWQLEASCVASTKTNV